MDRKRKASDGAAVPARGPEEVFETMSEAEALVIKGLLDTAGIQSAVFSLQAPQDILPGVGGVAIRVPAEQAAEARRIVEEHRRAQAQGADGSAP